MTTINAHLFVLPKLLLNPGGKVSLNIFEPRYQAMIDDCLLTKTPMAIGTAHEFRQLSSDVRVPHEKYFYVHQTVGLGPIRLLHTAENGYRLILITGQMKGKILNVTENNLGFLSAEIEVIQENLKLDGRNTFLFRRLHALIEDKVKPMLTEERDRKVLMDSLIHPSEVVAFYCENILNSMEAKTYLLELDDINEKIQFLAELILRAPETKVSQFA
ncbi:MAG: hypothetical protein Fur0010_20670 [Bdellovibrio sp.]